jgi:hypothetical protein
MGHAAGCDPSSGLQLPGQPSPALRLGRREQRRRGGPALATAGSGRLFVAALVSAHLVLGRRGLSRRHSSAGLKTGDPTL